MFAFHSNLRFLYPRLGLQPDVFASLVGAAEAEVEGWLKGKGTPNLYQLAQLSAMLRVNMGRLVLDDLTLRTETKDIRLLVLDVDGVLTDGGIYLTEKGDEFKKFNARDGRGIMSAQKQGIEVAFCSGGTQSEAIRHRAERLGVKRWYVGKAPKASIVQQWLAESNWDFTNVAYVGDDANDLEMIAKAGLSACPSDAARANLDSVDIILSLPGGQGCVREFIELYLGVEVD
jgi:3-deoxy-D-manno-octulosonate 8-phosphate phosphatase (KDO 8-P phosphatase)